MTRTRYFEPSRPRVLAHRGLATDAPENTLRAFRTAVDAGAEYLETDVHASRDGIAVISHDPDLSRVAGRAERIEQLSIDELRRVDLGYGQSFVALVDALRAFPETRFNIDVKSEAAARPAVDAVRVAGAASRVLLTSFSDARRRRLEAMLPGVASSTGQAGVVAVRVASLLGLLPLVRAALRGASALQVPEHVGPLRLVTRRFVELAHRAGAEVHVWTVNEPAEMRRLLDLGVDGIVTDRADLALALIADGI